MILEFLFFMKLIIIVVFDDDDDDDGDFLYRCPILFDVFGPIIVGSMVNIIYIMYRYCMLFLTFKHSISFYFAYDIN
jgi:hypothetical protein